MRGHVLPQAVDALMLLNARAVNAEILAGLLPYLIELRPDLQLKAETALERASCGGTGRGQGGQGVRERLFHEDAADDYRADPGNHGDPGLRPGAGGARRAQGRRHGPLRHTNEGDDDGRGTRVVQLPVLRAVTVEGVRVITVPAVAEALGEPPGAKDDRSPLTIVYGSDKQGCRGNYRRPTTVKAAALPMLRGADPDVPP